LSAINTAGVIKAGGFWEAYIFLQGKFDSFHAYQNHPRKGIIKCLLFFW